ncbi:DUF1367 family protein [Atlantibacter sp.]|uniref:DUF1367 family protein n=1 Tax=Atlantibacter sp. TaxID=1903473 RepID=UPI0028A9146E|nr:DUF1367 family protein [Atlantibacter sp.]
MAQLHLMKQSSGVLIPASVETSDFLHSKCKLGAVLVADFKKVRNPAFHRRFFALLNLGFDYWEPTGGAISSNERRLVNGYARYLSAFGGNESALMDAAEQYLDQVASRRITNGISLCKSFDAYRAWVTIESGHFRTTGANPELRFNEDNCHRQCAPCNNHLSGNLTAYRPALIAKIGQARFDALMGPHELPKWKRDDYIRIRDEYRAKLRQLKQQEAA